MRHLDGLARRHARNVRRALAEVDPPPVESLVRRSDDERNRRRRRGLTAAVAAAALVVVVALPVALLRNTDGTTAEPAMTTTTSGAPSATASSLPATTSTTHVEATPVVLEASAGVEWKAPVSDAPIEQLVEGFNNAGFDLWQHQPVESNSVFSPSSIGHALLMARGAADETTGDAIDAAVGLPAGLSAHQAWNATAHWILDSAAAAEPLVVDEDEESDESEVQHVVVTMADRIWPDLTTTPDQDWIDLLIAEHGATVEALDLRGNPEGSAKAINSWIDEQTRGLIPQMLAPADIEEAILVLTDTIYFKAPWLVPFPVQRTEPDTFTLLDGSTVEVDFMAYEKTHPDAALGNGYVAADIPYMGEEFSMLLIVPDQGRFAEIRNRLDQGLLDEIDAALTSGENVLFMPRWETDSSLDLMPWLTSIGAAPGSYPGIDPAAFLGGAKHGAKIIVDELGTEAAAATSFTFAVSRTDPDIVVDADQPFLYLIRHDPTGLVLFAGQVTDPTA